MGCTNKYYCANGKARSKDNPYERSPRPHPSTASTSTYGSTIVGFNFSDAGNVAWEETADSAVDSTLKYKQPNRFSQMQASDMTIYGLGVLSVVNDYLGMFASYDPGADNVFASLNWEKHQGVLTVTSIDLINLSALAAKITKVGIEIPNKTQSTSYGPSSWVDAGRSANQPGMLNYPLSPQRGANQSQSIYVDIFVKSFGAPAKESYINISGSVSGSGNYRPDYGPWMRDN